MDPPLINEASFTASANPSSYSLTGLLSFPTAGGGLGFRMREGADGPLEESTLTEHSGGAKRRSDNKRVSAIIPKNDLKNDNGKRPKFSGPSDENDGPIETTKPEPPKDFIHVRARRGQATDSHSLAERARREKISERMKILQDLVPGCNKVIGKALVLDEIINYIQSLQHQVEFLSMKLEAVNSTSRVNPTLEDFPLKDIAAQGFDAGAMLYGLHMHVGSEFDREVKN